MSFYGCHNMIDKEVLQLFMEAIISIISRRGLTIVEHHRNQCNKTMLVHYKQLIYFNGHLKQLCISNMMEWFSYLKRWL